MKCNTRRRREVSVPVCVNFLSVGGLGDCRIPAEQSGIKYECLSRPDFATRFTEVETGFTVDSCIREAQEAVADIMRNCFSRRFQEAVPEVDPGNLLMLMDTLEDVTKGVPQRSRAWCSWGWARVAGELYDRLHGPKMRELLDRCALVSKRPPGLTDQWYLAKLLQGSERRSKIRWWMGCMNAQLDDSIHSTMVLCDRVLGPHFVRFPVTTESERRVIYSITQVVSWLIGMKTQSGVLKKVSDTCKWTRNDHFAIPLTTFLRDLWGPERFRRIAQLARRLLHTVKANMSDECLLSRFLGAVSACATCRMQSFCSRIGFDSNTRDSNPLDSNPQRSHTEDSSLRDSNEAANVDCADPSSPLAAGPSSPLAADPSSPLAADPSSPLTADPSSPLAGNRSACEDTSACDRGAPLDVVQTLVEEAQQIVVQVIQDCGQQDVTLLPKTSSAPTPASLERAMSYLENRILKPCKLPVGWGKTHYCGWERANMAGELYKKMDRNRMLALLKRCDAAIGRPEGITDQWFLAKLLQRFACAKSMPIMAKYLHIKLGNSKPGSSKPGGSKPGSSKPGGSKPFNIYDIVMARHFTELPETTESDKLRIWTMCQIVGWMLKTKLREPFTSVAVQKWTVIDGEFIELTAFLFKLWGPERFRTVTNLARTLLPVNVVAMSDACFLACFLHSVLERVRSAKKCWFEHVGFHYAGHEDWHPVEKEGPDFFGRLPVNWDQRAVSTTASHQVHSVFTLSEISHKEASRSAMQYATALHNRTLQEVEKILCASYAALDLRKRTGAEVEDDECPEGKRTKFHDTCIAV
ncbi:hypothetical protein GNI_006220 [Gregarina niphandrodes]|uniref:Uncharacterized protein n=1 Tax=Gregarina niphandrodes TaxID=110365 RepID=A0A023BDD4_GRENI|nr:hypothetical protein GNI_006220 [Gregarina niphandrodes]EZG87866.1 hypothetical protein GNI_006220 [Gregarina niphandrodes]|eukprot:XP_011128635.1 hypothetical protein GNI_006220 [Gregarina niphandrodes]